MADVEKFTLDGVDINVKDTTARTDISSISAQAQQNSNDIADLKALSRLTVSYNGSTETITFTTATH